MFLNINNLGFIEISRDITKDDTTEKKNILLDEFKLLLKDYQILMLLDSCEYKSVLGIPIHNSISNNDIINRYLDLEKKSKNKLTEVKN